MSTMRTCRACKSNNLYCYLPLGDHPAANAFVQPENADKPDQVFPLNTHVCLSCGLIQVPNQLPPDFFLEYVYLPSSSATMPQHFRTLARHLKDKFVTEPGQLIIDIGCNDGLLLGACHDEGLETLGVDPATNIVSFARAKGLEVFNEYFTKDSAETILQRYGQAQIIVTTNTFNHVDNLHDFMAGVEMLLSPDGIFVIEVPQALACIRDNEFDTVYHEHVSVFSVASVQKLGQRFDLNLVDLEELPVHGGSMRLYLRRKGPPSPVVAASLQRERDAGLFERETYIAHAARVESIRDELMKLLHKLKEQGKRLAGYGAPAKGNTLLNYFNIGRDLLDYLVDLNVLKQGRLSPGMRIPVLSPAAIGERSPDYLLILAWNFADEIMMQQTAFRARGGKFILPIPKPRIVG